MCINYKYKSVAKVITSEQNQKLIYLVQDLAEKTDIFMFRRGGFQGHMLNMGVWLETCKQQSRWITDCQSTVLPVCSSLRNRITYSNAVQILKKV